jgi:transposase
MAACTQTPALSVLLFTKPSGRLWIKGERSVVKERKSIVEHPYGTIKRAMEAGYCLCKGKGTVSGEFALTFLAYNMKRVINIVGTKNLLKAFA